VISAVKREAPGGRPAFRGHAEVEISLRSLPRLGTDPVRVDARRRRRLRAGGPS
jgi:hypothetical protein